MATTVANDDVPSRNYKNLLLRHPLVLVLRLGVFAGVIFFTLRALPQLPNPNLLVIGMVGAIGLFIAASLLPKRGDAMRWFVRMNSRLIGYTDKVNTIYKVAYYGYGAYNAAAVNRARFAYAVVETVITVSAALGVAMLIHLALRVL